MDWIDSLNNALYFEMNFDKVSPQYLNRLFQIDWIDSLNNALYLE